MLRFKDLNEKEKNLWAVLFLAKSVDIVSNISEKEFVNKMINFERAEYLLGAAFLYATSDIYRSIYDLASLLDFEVIINKLTDKKIKQIKNDTLILFEKEFKDVNELDLLKKLRDYYSIL